MTEKTQVFSIRLEVRDKEELGRHLTRECAEAMLRQMRRGEIELTSRGVVFKNNQNSKN